MKRPSRGMFLGLAILFLLSLSFAIQPFAEGSFKTFIILDKSGPTVHAYMWYGNLSYFSKLNEQNFPPLDPARRNEFYKPGDYSDTNFSANAVPLANQSLYFTFDGNKISDKNGNPICDPVITNETGEANCTIAYYFNGTTGGVLKINLTNETKSCGSLNVEFKGKSVGKANYPSASEAMIFCPPTNSALSSLGTAIPAAFSGNILVCFPALLIMGMLVASMYYAGKDPLSLFDLTTPRLPRVRPFRVKSAVAPQMIRSVLRKYVEMRYMIRKDIWLVGKEAIHGKARTLPDADRKKFIKENMEKLRGYVSDLKTYSKAYANSKEGSKEGERYGAELVNVQTKFQALFTSLKLDSPGAMSQKMFNRLNARLGRSMELVSGLAQVHQKAHISPNVMSEARGKGGGRVSKRIGKITDAITAGIVAFERNKGVRFVERIPLLGGLLMSPIRVYDIGMQFRASRRGIKGLRRELMGGFLDYVLFTKVERKDGEKTGKRVQSKMGKMMEKFLGPGTLIGSITNKWNGWDFKKFQESHSISGKSVNMVMEKLNEALDSEICGINTSAADVFRRLIHFSTLGIGHLDELEKTLKDDRKSLINDIKNAKGAGKTQLKAQLKNVENALKSIDTLNKQIDAGDFSKLPFKDIKKSLALLGANLEKGSTNRHNLESITLVNTAVKNLQEINKILGSEVSNLQKAEAIYKLNLNGNTTDNKALRTLIGELRGIEKQVNEKMPVYLDKKTGMVHALRWEDLKAYREHAIFKALNDPKMKATEHLAGKLGAEAFGKLSTDQKKAAMRTHNCRTDGELKMALGMAAFGKMSAVDKYNAMMRVGLSDGIVKDLKGTFGSVDIANMTKKEYDKKMVKAHEFLNPEANSLSDPNNKKNNPVLRQINKAVDKFNQSVYDSMVKEGIDGKDHKLFVKNLNRFIMFGNYSNALYMDVWLKLTAGKSFDPGNKMIGGMDDVENHFSKGLRTKEFHDELNDRISRGLFGAELKKLYDLAITDPVKAAATYGPKYAESIKKMSSAEQTAALHASIRENAFTKLIGEGNKFAHLFQASIWNSGTFLAKKQMRIERTDLNGQMILDFLGAQAIKTISEQVSAGQRMETAQKKFQFAHDSSEYNVKTGKAVLMARAYEQFDGFALWKGMRGMPRGDDYRGKLASFLDANWDHTGMVNQFYRQLVTEGSFLYDKRFVKKLTDKGFDPSKLDYATYKMLMERGRTFDDIRNGLGFLISGDRRGGLPLLEHDSKMLAAQGVKNGIIPADIGKGLKGEDALKTRLLSGLVARLPVSKYSDLPDNLVIMIKYKDANGRERWLYGHPKKDETVRMLMQAASQYKDASLSLGQFLAGVDSKTGKIDLSVARVIALSQHDFNKFAKSNPNNIFGDMTAGEKLRERGRQALYGVGQKFGEVLYSALGDRIVKLQKWNAAQMQVRFSLYALSAATDEYMVVGTKRWGLIGEGGEVGLNDPKSDDIIKKKAMVGEERKEGGHISEKVYQERKALMEKEHVGDDTFAGNARAFWYKFKRSMASKTVDFIADAESQIYTSRTELRAIEKQYNKGSISKTEYAEEKSMLNARISEFKTDYKEAKKEFKTFDEVVIRWTGSHSGPYGSTKNPFTKWGVFDKWLDSKYVQGYTDEFFQIAESSSMRDPRTATGAGYGLDYSFYVGYQTGQNTYERASFWATSSGWERSRTMPLNVTQAAHRWFNDYMSYGMRKSSGYPAWFEMDAMNPGAHGHRDPLAGFLAPFQAHYHSDYFKQRAQGVLDHSGISTIIGAYMDTGSKDPTQRGFLKKALDFMFINAEHYSTPAMMRGLSRPLDRYNEFERRMNSMLEDDTVLHTVKTDTGVSEEKTFKQVYDDYLSAESGSVEKKQLWKEHIAPIMKVFDPRELGVQESHSGGDIGQDGSMNRFMELFNGFHSNIWKPVTPGELDVNPITGHYGQFPHMPGMLKQYSSDKRMGEGLAFNLTVDDKTGETKDTFNTYQDATRDVYKRKDTLLFHAIKLQSEMMDYSFFNSPALWFMNPISGFVYKGVTVPFTRNTEKYGPHGLKFGILPFISRYSSSGSILEPYAEQTMKPDPESVWGGGKIDGYGSKFKDATEYDIERFLPENQKSTGFFARRLHNAIERYRYIKRLKKINKEGWYEFEDW